MIVEWTKSHQPQNPNQRSYQNIGRLMDGQTCAGFEGKGISKTFKVEQEKQLWQPHFVKHKPNYFWKGQTRARWNEIVNACCGFLWEFSETLLESQSKWDLALVMKCNWATWFSKAHIWRQEQNNPQHSSEASSQLHTAHDFLVEETTAWLRERSDAMPHRASGGNCSWHKPTQSCASETLSHANSQQSSQTLKKAEPNCRTEWPARDLKTSQSCTNSFVADAHNCREKWASRGLLQRVGIVVDPSDMNYKKHRCNQLQCMLRVQKAEASPARHSPFYQSKIVNKCVQHAKKDATHLRKSLFSDQKWPSTCEQTHTSFIFFTASQFGSCCNVA